MRAASHSLAAFSAIVAAPIAAAALAARPDWREGFGERLGWLPLTAGAGGSFGAGAPLWIHGASVGEVVAASRLVEELLGAGESVVVSTTTTSGRAVMRHRSPHVPCHLAPLDHAWTAAAALRRVAPRMLVLVETELWPVWIAEADRRGVPVVVVSGRLSDRAFPRYRRLAPLVRRMVGRISAVGARTDVDARRFVALGADPRRVSVTGDLKLEPPADPPPLAADLDAALGDVPLVVAGSTHPGEDEALLDALGALEASGAEAALLLAPRHPHSSGVLADRVRASGRQLLLRSALADERLERGGVLLLDTLGELAAVYARARLVFVGGTLVPVGGHNLLEPVYAGCPVFFGPHVENASHAASILERSGAGQRVSDPAALAAALVHAFHSIEERERCAAAGRAVLEAHRGAVRRSLALIRSHLLETADGARPS